ncbi:MAG: hypothetical protein A2Z18_07005 [Armatimonadetes bacterium RBG_16_58_9]|nr:MAG: hypothetical protein A2Z18_07005 [Armatimonadetes bacterium RBG_16_58_9]
MKRFLLPILTICAVALATCATGVDWTHVGTCGFVAPDPSIYRNAEWIIINSILVDSSGNVWCTANFDDDSVLGYGGEYFLRSGGLTCFKTDSTRIDINLRAFGFPGAVTKLVKGGDGKIYALQNYTRYEGSQPDGFVEFVEHRILKITPGGTVTKVWSPGPVVAGKPANNVISGMAVGGDGNVYWTTNGIDCQGNPALTAAPYAWKYHFFWRYDVANDVVQECPEAIGVDNGWNEIHRMLDFEYVGDDTFAVIGRMNDQAQWTLCPFKWHWDPPRVPNRVWTSNDCNVSDPGRGRQFVTATAYDPVRKQLWAGGRSKVEAPLGPWYVHGDPGIVVRLNESNKGFRQADKGPGYSNYGLTHAWNDTNIAARFMVESYDDDSGAIHVIRNSSPGTVFPAVACAVRIENDHFWVYDAIGFASLVDLGPVVPGEFNEVVVYGNCQDRTARVYWNWTEVYAGNLAPYSYIDGSQGRVEFGASNQTAPGGSSTVVFDWVGIGPGFVDLGSPANSFSYYLDGSVCPGYELRSNIMSRWNGARGNSTVFGPEPWHVESIDNWHANSYDEVQSPQPGTYLNGHYWISGLAVNPASGRAWVAWGAERTYTYDDISRVHIVPSRIDGMTPPLEDSGVPEPGAQVAALTFDADSNRVYALTVNLASGIFNVYGAEPPPFEVVASCGAMKAESVGSPVKTDVAKVVTWPEYAFESDHFYIQDQDGFAGIKVVPAKPADVQAKGTLVSVAGNLDVVDGEAAITGASVTAEGSAEAKPVAMSIKCVGGAATGIQPATDPSYGPSNVCSLVRITGRARAYVEDDDSGLRWFTLDDGSGAKTKYLSGGQLVEVEGIKVDADYWIDPSYPPHLVVTGISSVEPQFGNRRVIRIRDLYWDVVEVYP